MVILNIRLDEKPEERNKTAPFYLDSYCLTVTQGLLYCSRYC